MTSLDDEQLIYQIRNLLEIPGDPPADRVAPLAEAYGRRCDEVNARLRECQQLLRQGLRGEALHRAQHEPGVLDQLSLLVFEERQQFVEMCLQLDIEPPGKLLTDVAARLTEAGETERVLSVLMRKHRLLALARAPLSKRISTLRQIREADTENNVWQRDLSKFEQARHQQIQTEAEQAYRTGDLGTLISLDKELQDPGWTQKPPTAIIDLVHRASAQLHATRAALLMKELAPQLAECLQQEDQFRARELKQQWDSCGKALRGQRIAADIERIAAPALQWIAREMADQQREQEYCDAVQALEISLENPGPSADVPLLWQQVKAFNRPLPESLEQRVKQQVRVVRARRNRRRLMLVSAVACVAIALIGVGGVAWQQVNRAQTIAEHVEAVDRLLSQQRIEEARQYLFTLNDSAPDIAQTGELRAREVRISGLIEKERERRVSVSNVIAAIETAANFAAPTFKSLSEAEQIIKSAGAIELRSSDEAQLTVLKERIVDTRKEVQRQLDEAFGTEVASLEKRAAEIAKSLETGSETQVDTNKLAQEMRALRNRSGQISPAPIAQLDALILQQDRLAREASDRVERRQAVTRIAESIPDLTAFHNALKSYAQRYSGTPRATQFLSSGKEIPLWQAMERWNQFAERWQNVDLTTIKPDDATKLLADSKQLLGDELAVAFPGAEVLASRVPFLESIVARGADNRTPLKKLSGVLNDPSITSLRMVQVTQPNGAVKRYYLLEPPLVSGGTQVTLKIVTGFDLTRSNKVTQIDQVVKAGSELDTSPAHVAIGQRLQSLLGKELDTRGWELTMLDCLEAIQKPADVEPLVRLLMLERTLEAASKGSVSLAKSLQPMRDMIAAAEIQLTANWLNPDDPAATLERQKAASLIARLPQFAELRSTVETELATLKRPWLERYTWVGCLLKEDSPLSTWRCATRTQSNISGDLVVVTREGADGKVVLDRIGKLQAGAAVLDTAKASSLSEGRAVYALVKR
jgi:hypothetical protein